MSASTKILDYNGNAISVPQKIKWGDIIGTIAFVSLYTLLVIGGTLFVNGIVDDKVSTVSDVTPTYFYASDAQTWSTSDNESASAPEPPEVIAQGSCVDIASAILFMLDRKYEGSDKAQVAVTFNHCQAVLDHNGEKSFLGLAEASNVYKKESEFFGNPPLAYIGAQDFLDAAATLKPDLNVVDLLAFLYDNPEKTNGDKDEL